MPKPDAPIFEYDDERDKQDGWDDTPIELPPCLTERIEPPEEKKC